MAYLCYISHANSQPSLSITSPMSKDVLLPDNLTDEEYAAAFLREFGADIGKPVIYQIKYYVIDKRLFINKRVRRKKVRPHFRQKQKNQRKLTIITSTSSVMDFCHIKGGLLGKASVGLTSYDPTTPGFCISPITNSMAPMKRKIKMNERGTSELFLGTLKK